MGATAELAQSLPELARELGLRAIHLLSRGLPGNAETIAQLAANGVRVSVEPVIQEGMDATQVERVLASLPHVEIFFAGLPELRVLVGDTPPQWGAARAGRARPGAGGAAHAHPARWPTSARAGAFCACRPRPRAWWM